MPFMMAVFGFKAVISLLNDMPDMRHNLFGRLFYGLESGNVRADDLISGIAGDMAIGVIDFNDTTGHIYLPESFARGIQHHPQFTECRGLMQLRNL